MTFGGHAWGGGEELGSVESPGIVAISVLQRACPSLDPQTFMPLVSARRDVDFAFGICVTQLDLSGVFCEMPLLLSSEVSGWQAGGMGLPPLPPRLRQCNSQPGSSRWLREPPRLRRGHRRMPAASRSSRCWRHHDQWDWHTPSVEPLLFQRGTVIEDIRSASPPCHLSIVTHNIRA